MYLLYSDALAVRIFSKKHVRQFFDIFPFFKPKFRQVQKFAVRIFLPSTGALAVRIFLTSTAVRIFNISLKTAQIRQR